MSGRPHRPDDAAFDRWLADGLAPDDRDRAAGRRVADAWRDRRRAIDRAAPASPSGPPLVRRRWSWAPVVLAAVAAVLVLAWPAPTVVDDAALASAYLDALGALPLGAP